MRQLPFAVLAILIASSPSLASIDDGAPLAASDYLFPSGGGLTATVASGLPFLGIAEVAYGLTDRFSLGALVGATPDLPGVDGTLAIGLRPRVVLLERGPWRANLIVSILAYPAVKGFGRREPWMLTRPTLIAERALASGIRLNAGMGLIGAACLSSILSLGQERDMDGGLWNTASVGASLPLSPRVNAFADASVILHGVKVAHDWLGGAPLVAYAGVVTSF